MLFTYKPISFVISNLPHYFIYKQLPTLTHFFTSMDYNTQRTHLVLPEYGRHIQEMVNYLLTVEDREARNKQALAVIAIMGSMNPHLRDVNDFKHKLWDHLHIMAKFQLDIDSPYPKPNAETLDEKPKKVSYPSHAMKIKHYGQAIEQVILEITKMEDGPQKEYFTQLVANQMKKSYLTWNKDSVSDEDIFRDLTVLSAGKLSVSSGVKLHEAREREREKDSHKMKKKFQGRKK